MNRMSVFIAAKNDAGYVQAVILESDYPVYSKLGFVASVDDIKQSSKGANKAAKNGDDSDEG